MSERGTFVSEALVYFQDAEAVAAALVAHLDGFSPTIIEREPGAAYAVAGIARASYPGGEWEDFKSLPPFAFGVSVLIFCDSGQVIRFNLQTGEFSHV